jgi:hypothetical protein
LVACTGSATSVDGLVQRMDEWLEREHDVVALKALMSDLERCALI